MNDDPPRSLDAAYKAYRPLLFAALARLGKSGIEIPFGDGLDLVHDFFIEDYSALRERFDPDRGQFTTYLFAAFSRFARSRVLRAARLRTFLPELEPPDSTVSETEFDASRVQVALNALDANTRALLLEYFDQGTSERTLATNRNVSRHRIREDLVDALGALVVALGDRGPRGSRDWQFARAFWGERRSLEDAAATAGMTYAQGHRVRSRLLAEFKKLARS